MRKVSAGLAGAASLMFAAGFVSSQGGSAQSGGAKGPSIAFEMLTAYGRLMNDPILLDQGFMGPERVPGDPSDVHSTRAKGDSTSVRHATSTSQRVIRDLRKKASKQGINFGDGLLRAKGGKVLFWRGTKGRRSPAYEFRAAAELELASKEAVKAALRSPYKTFEKPLSNGKLFAKAIRFESTRCLSCHEGARVNDVAGVAAVVVAPPMVGSMNGRSIAQPLPKNLEAELGVGLYPSSGVLRLPSYVLKEKTDIYRVTLKTKDAPSAVRKYYVAELRKHRGVVIRETEGGLSRIEYEFGDRHYGSITVLPGKEVTSIWLQLFRIRRQPSHPAR